MQHIRLGRTGVEVPAIGFGTWAHGGPNQDESNASVGWSGHDDEQSRDALVAAWEHGLTHWDTADVYGEGHAEELIGSLWDRVPRQEIFLASKVGWDKGGHDHYYHPQLVRDHMERSLRLLRTDALDLYYLHHCDFGPDDRYLDDALDLLHRFRDEGKLRFLGLSDWDNGEVARLAPRVDPDVVQPLRNLWDDTYASSGLQAWVEGHDAGVCFFSPLKHGLLLGKYEQPPGVSARRLPAERSPVRRPAGSGAPAPRRRRRPPPLPRPSPPGAPRGGRRPAHRYPQCLCPGRPAQPAAGGGGGHPGRAVERRAGGGGGAPLRSRLTCG